MSRKKGTRRSRSLVSPYVASQLLDIQVDRQRYEGAYIFMAVHAETFHLHNPSVLISLHQISSGLELRLRSIVLLLINRHDGCCKEVY